MDEGAPVVIPPAIDYFWILTAPPFDAALLLAIRCARFAVPGNDCRFKVIGESDHQVDVALRHGTGKALPDESWKDPARIGQFLAYSRAPRQPEWLHRRSALRTARLCTRQRCTNPS